MDRIIGNTVGTTTPKADWNQTDERKADYIKNKPTILTISKIDESTDDNGNNVITFNDGSTLTIKNGAKGDTGEQGATGANGKDGVDGINGVDGKDGQNGEDGVGIETITVEDGNLKITLTNGTTLDLGNIKGDQGNDGAQGIPGEKGADGVSITHSWDGTVLTITSASGSSSVDLKGAQGEPGSDASISIDNAISDTSENAIQNKVIKAYVDNVASGAVQLIDAKLQEFAEEVGDNIGKNFVAKEYGKGLSTNDFTDDDKAKLDNSATQEYVQDYIAEVIGGIENGSY